MTEPEQNLQIDYLQSELFDSIAEKRVEALNFEYVDEGRLGKRAIVVKGMLSEEECEKMVAFIDAHDRPAENEGDVVMVAASSTPSHRNNQRVPISSEALSEVLFSRIASVLCSIKEDAITCTSENAHTFLNEGFGMTGEWKLHSLNSRFRLCKYHPGGHFGPHYDSDFVIDPMRKRSLKTFMIYLNDNYEGGTTNFAESHDMNKDEVQGIYCSPPDKVYASLKACRGDCLVFDHRLLHEGQQVTNGMKYLIRSDIMYEKVDDELSEEGKLQEKALKLYMEGMKLEEGGDVDSAIKLYGKAFKMCPEIEDAYS